MRKWLTFCLILLLLYAPGAYAQEPAAQQKQEKAPKLTPESEITLVRFINGEFVRVQPKQSLPCDPKKVVHLKVAGDEQSNAGAKKTVNKNEGSIRVVNRKDSGCQTGSGVALKIIGQSLDSGLAFDVDKGTIRIDLNGGTGRKKGSWKEHVQVGMGGAGGGRTIPLDQKTGTPPPDPSTQPLGFQNTPATIIVEFPGPIPDITPEELKKILLPLIAFQDKRSAAVQYIDSIDPKFREAIAKKEVIPGMDKDMVLAALGSKPFDCGQTSCIQREKDDQGVEVETWMYGPPPYTMFIYFVDGKVVRVNKPGFAKNSN